MVRSRQCTTHTGNIQKCQGDAVDHQKCNSSVLCQADGSWGSWKAWSSCSVTCGSGNMTRMRSCDNPVPVNGGQICEGSATEIASCHINTNCPVNGSWGHWSAWSSCSVTCGSGNMTRTRSCDNPAPSNGGKTCEGTVTESTSCSNETMCAVDGYWSNWTTWSSCSVTCGPGNMTRSRLCNNPLPVNGGKPCDGNATESRSCTNETMCAGRLPMSMVIVRTQLVRVPYAVLICILYKSCMDDTCCGHWMNDGIGSATANL
ncbi:hypothetical protein ACJMK2_026365 [Sinanodonta woodiana]|uniref:Uncharacterized protein n=1 Tax=Sinanodonta woodiana TaxID=1069815 RepID=A0ABD3XJE0_SINWO